MKYTRLLFLIIFQLFSHHVQPHNYYRAPIPTTPEASSVTADHVAGGRCVPVHQCQRISFMLATWQEPFPRHVRDYLQRSQCTSKGGVGVCCALNNIRIDDSHAQTDWNGRRWRPHKENYFPNAPNTYQSNSNSYSHYPNRQSFYPSFHNEYANYENSYPNNQNYYPNTEISYPPNQNLYSHMPNTYPHTQSTYPHTQNAYPHTQSTYPHTQSTYPNTQNTYPDTSNSHYSPQNSYPNGLSYGENLLNSMQCGAFSRDRISNGETVRIFEFPWMALLECEGTQSRKRFQCTGSLITDRYILTAAHCASGPHQIISVRLGEHNLSTEEDCERSFNSFDECAPPYEDISVEQIRTHPQYTAGSLMHDIALLRLKRVVQFQRHIQPICLPRFGNHLHVMPNELTISGWGETRKGFASQILMKASISLQATEHCNRVFSRRIQLTAEQICAGGELGRSTCHGDSGGPLFAAVPMHGTSKYVQFGISSGGAKVCGTHRNIPGIYTRVTSYLPWIAENIQP